MAGSNDPLPTARTRFAVSRSLRYGAAVLLFLLLLIGAAAYLALRGSLPRLDGQISDKSLQFPAAIERDDHGVPTIRARSRRDLAFATGFAHAQDRFFQMDLMRRAAAGELAALLGPELVAADRSLRAHAFRQVAAQVVQASTATERAYLEAYAAGVNSALANMRTRPWEYLLLRAMPRAWEAADCVLVGISMYLSLNDASGEDELARGLLQRSLPPELFAFMHPIGTEWDAPIVGGPVRAPSIPGPEVFDLRTERAARAWSRSTAALASRPPPAVVRGAFDLGPIMPGIVGSNAWAVAATHAAGDAALLANDMHLPLRLPNVWYHARLRVEASEHERRDLVGVTLPGVPALIAGSNGSVAWGYTNSYGDWTDLIAIVVNPEDPRTYLTATGAEPFDVREERIDVRGAPPVLVHIRATRFGPIVHTQAGIEYALAWTAHHPRATNFGLMQLETAGTVEEALSAAHRAGGPVQNILVVDANGHIGWSVQGQVPIRTERDHSIPALSTDARAVWQGWHTPERYPSIVDPMAGRIWSANARALTPDAWGAFMGEGGYDLGARAAQIRDALFALPTATAADMLRIQLDDRALFLQRWRDLLLDLLEADEPISKERIEVRTILQEWSGRADVGSSAYRIVRAFRNQVHDDVFAALTASARGRHPDDVRFTASQQFEGALWQLVTQRPLHLLDPGYSSWEAALLASLDTAIAKLRAQCSQLARCRWGLVNTLQMRHPMSGALPGLAAWLDMPASELPGDAAMPRVQRPSFGASQRMIVSPGREPDGLFQMPGGPTSHPLSPFYGAGHEAWAQGEPRPLLPGTPRHVLQLQPSG